MQAMRGQANGILGGMKEAANRQDAFAMAGLKDSMEQGMAGGEGEVAVANKALEGTSGKVADATAGVAAVQEQLGSILAHGAAQTKFKTQQNEAEMGRVLDGIVFGGQSSPSSFAEEIN